jgi:hypothetical protein
MAYALAVLVGTMVAQTNGIRNPGLTGLATSERFLKELRQ